MVNEERVHLPALLRRLLEPAQYLSVAYSTRLAEAGAVASAGSKGDSYDNAVAESLHGLYKAELIWPDGPWQSVAAVEAATSSYVAWFNGQRLHSACGWLPPAEYEQAWRQPAAPAG